MYSRLKAKYLLIVSTLLIFILFGAICIPKALAISPDSISADVSPQNPSPGENTTITLSSYSSNLDVVSISWSVGGKVSSSGIGKKSFSVTAGIAGSETAVTATIALPDGNIEKKIIIRPSKMILFWQANDSYVPPFYKGKALPTPDSQVKVVALPEIKTGSGMVNPANMVYAWKEDYTNNVDGSGYGKNAFIYINDYLDNSNNIDVTASTIDQKYSSEASIDIATYQPKIVFYKNDASLGTIWEQALTDPHKIQTSGIIEAAPYFISPKDIRNPRLLWSWFINDTQVAIQGFKNNLMPLQAQSGVSGTSRVKLQIDNQDKIFETASKEINIQF